MYVNMVAVPLLYIAFAVLCMHGRVVNGRPVALKFTLLVAVVLSTADCVAEPPNLGSFSLLGPTQHHVRILTSMVLRTCSAISSMYLRGGSSHQYVVHFFTDTPIPRCFSTAIP